MEPSLIKFVSALHVFWYRLTGGLIGGRAAGGNPVLLLTTSGRRTGNERTTPLLYLQDGENFVVVASYGGSDYHPAWWLNLKANPESAVQIRGERLRAKAEEAGPEEKARLWPLLTKMYPGYDDYQRRTERQIPVVILRPQG
ncbi:MAG: nitroreductase family deazaflavin-dependent oxidoreductase [Chloroflexi bacterium]|nr:nitroreductase family deazaflavin-dependent oxidoreductase [Chloroflexota bacterium]